MTTSALQLSMESCLGDVSCHWKHVSRPKWMEYSRGPVSKIWSDWRFSVVEGDSNFIFYQIHPKYMPPIGWPFLDHTTALWEVARQSAEKTLTTFCSLLWRMFTFLSLKTSTSLWVLFSLQATMKEQDLRMLKLQGRAKMFLLSSVTHVPSGLMGCASAALC